MPLLFITCLVVVVFFSILKYYRHKRIVKKIKANPVYTSAKIVHYKWYYHVGRSAIWLFYEFKVNGTLIKGKFRYAKLTKDKNDWIINQSFPLVYCGDDPKYSRLLLTKWDFEKFDKVQPEEYKFFNGKIV